MRIVFLLLVVFLIGCDHSFKGTVVDKKYEPERTWLQPIPHEVCTTSSNGATNCTTWYSYIEQTDDEDFLLVIKKADGKKSDLKVTKKIWNDSPLGYYWDGKKLCPVALSEESCDAPTPVSLK